jgi:hypothetical protein
LADRDQQGQLLTLESQKLGSGDEVPVTKMSVHSNIVSPSTRPTAQTLPSAMKVAAFKIRTQRYLQVIFRMFSM